MHLYIALSSSVSRLAVSSHCSSYYCNERIQQVFIDSVLRMEQEVYVYDGLDWDSVKFTTNEPICGMIEVCHNNNNY